MKYYTESHEWVDVENNVATVGVSFFASEELGSVVYVELPEISKNIKAGEEAAVLESTKAAADVYAPVSGKILEVNNALKENSELINTSAEHEGWLFKLQLSNPEELKSLLSEEDYRNLIRDA